MIPFVQKYAFKRENDVSSQSRGDEKMKTLENEKTKYSFHQSIKHLLKIKFNVNSENKGKLAVTVAKGIMYVLFILLAVTLMFKIIIDCITGRVDIGTVLISFLVFTVMNLFLRAAYESVRNKL